MCHMWSAMRSRYRSAAGSCCEETACRRFRRVRIDAATIGPRASALLYDDPSTDQSAHRVMLVTASRRLLGHWRLADDDDRHHERRTQLARIGGLANRPAIVRPLLGRRSQLLEERGLSCQGSTGRDPGAQVILGIATEAAITPLGHAIRLRYAISRKRYDRRLGTVRRSQIRSPLGSLTSPPWKWTTSRRLAAWSAYSWNICARSARVVR